jgi:hypothetical protein
LLLLARDPLVRERGPEERAVVSEELAHGLESGSDLRCPIREQRLPRRGISDDERPATAPVTFARGGIPEEFGRADEERHVRHPAERQPILPQQAVLGLESQKPDLDPVLERDAAKRGGAEARVVSSQRRLKRDGLARGAGERVEHRRDSLMARQEILSISLKWRNFPPGMGCGMDESESTMNSCALTPPGGYRRSAENLSRFLDHHAKS